MAARLAIGTSNRPATWWLLTGSIVPLLFGDAVFVFLQVSNDWGTWQHQQPLDLCWILFYVAFGTAALHPWMVSLSEPTPVTVRLSRGRLMSQLRPPVLDELGMASALSSHGGAFQDASGVACTVNADAATQLTDEQETVLYRVTQEALSNVAKHARASRVWVLLGSDNGLTRLQIRDDGVGFDPAMTSTAEPVEHGHFGLAGMRERVEMVGGRLPIDSGSGRGTTIAVEPAVDPALQAASRAG